MIAAKKHYDPKKVDLWSCGIILFSMVCGHLPFCDTDTKTLYKKILSGVYKIPAHVSPLAKNLI
jgi:5'-AMP-activated protein kinase catalytic alpha subunit